MKFFVLLLSVVAFFTRQMDKVHGAVELVNAVQVFNIEDAGEYSNQFSQDERVPDEERPGLCVQANPEIIKVLKVTENGLAENPAGPMRHFKLYTTSDGTYWDNVNAFSCSATKSFVVRKRGDVAFAYVGGRQAEPTNRQESEDDEEEES